jgi:phage terminase small subunit
MTMAKKREYADPLAYFERVMNDESEETRVRLDAGKSLALYTKSKPGELGKKEQKDIEAGKVAGGRFSPAKPPLQFVKR